MVRPPARTGSQKPHTQPWVRLALVVILPVLWLVAGVVLLHPVR